MDKDKLNALGLILNASLVKILDNNKATFFLMLFDDKEGYLGYISNAKRQPIAEAIRELMAKWGEYVAEDTDIVESQWSRLKESFPKACEDKEFTEFTDFLRSIFLFGVSAGRDSSQKTES